MPVGQESGDAASAATPETTTEHFADWLSASDDAGTDPAAEDDAPAQSDETENADEVPDDAAESEADDSESDPVEEQDEPDEQPQSLPAKIKVKIDGKDHEVTLEEAAAGYSRTQDYTRKTQKLAEDRKVIESEKNETRAARDQYRAKLTALDEVLKGADQEPDWDKLQRENPDAFAATHAAWQIGQQRLAAIRAERAKVEQAAQKDAQDQWKAHLTAESEKLSTALPAWSDPKTGKQLKADMHEYASGFGFTNDDLKNISDHRVLVILHKAMLYDKGVTKTKADNAKAKQKIDKVKAATPGSPRQSKPQATKLNRAKERLAKSGGVHDAARAFELAGFAGE